ncbi:Hypothetical predicted protein [Olea europaea subsp. europaea]|uniref:Uncharacterized protein n=1 Tax=Olea europaea subsp. europaea TaxID=158383 RepID=A0A8S0UTU6_OLEEU|nr:Hypothetical predicted protein [Olea europaea subsp. europaea]
MFSIEGHMLISFKIDAGSLLRFFKLCRYNIHFRSSENQFVSFPLPFLPCRHSGIYDMVYFMNKAVKPVHHDAVGVSGMLMSRAVEDVRMDRYKIIREVGNDSSRV